MPAGTASLTVSAIVVNHQREDLLGACLASLRAALSRSKADGELVVVDNGSNDGSCELVRRDFPEAQLIELDRNGGFAAGVRAGMQRARASWILLLNNDATVEPDAIDRLLRAAASAGDVGSVAAQIRFVGESPVINSAGIEIDRLGVAYDRLLGEPPDDDGREPIDVFGASAGGALYRRAMLDEIGGFDASFFAFMEDADVAWRARMRGWRCLYAPGAVVHHHHSATAGHGSSFKYFHVGLNRVRLLAKNADRMHLVRWALPMLAYDAAYVGFVALTARTLAPLRGRLRGLTEWRSYRRAAGPRSRVDLVPVRGARAALRRWRVFSGRRPERDPIARDASRSR